jgi:hypothetical protein
MNMCMRNLILGAAIGIAPAVTTISPAQAGMIGPGKLHITEPASLVEPVRGRRPGRHIYVGSRVLNLKAVQFPRGRYCHHDGCQK